ncbi:MAG: SRPBCC family protein [Jatrophihabitantaceae bacterium]
MSWHALEPVDESFFVTAPHIYRFPVDLPVPPERVWQSLTSDESIAAWGPAVKSLRWTTPRPFGEGSTREVALPLGTITVRERFFVWDEGKRYSFAVYEADRPFLRRFAEDYVVEPHGGGTRFTWTIAIEAEPRYRLLVALSSPVNRLSFGQAARSAKSYFAKHP